jgi:inosine-uridine nucleoside N-ribohydrolase
MYARHFLTGLGDISKRYPNISTPSEEELTEVLDIAHGEPGYKAVLRLLQEQPDNSVIYVALGPLTNLALALRENAELFRRKVKFVSIMGGALDVPGNTSPVAEFNVYAVSQRLDRLYSGLLLADP